MASTVLIVEEPVLQPAEALAMVSAEVQQLSKECCHCERMMVVVVQELEKKGKKQKVLKRLVKERRPEEEEKAPLQLWKKGARIDGQLHTLIVHTVLVNGKTWQQVVKDFCVSHSSINKIVSKVKEQAHWGHQAQLGRQVSPPPMKKKSGQWALKLWTWRFFASPLSSQTHQDGCMSMTFDGSTSTTRANTTDCTRKTLSNKLGISFNHQLPYLPLHLPHFGVLIPVGKPFATRF